MAVINLGTRSVDVGGAPQLFDPFVYSQSQAYLIAANMTVSNINNVFSFIRVRPLITVSSQPSFYVAPYTDLDIRAVLQAFYFPASSLFRGDGSVVFELERLPFSAGYGDTTSVQVTLF